MDPYIGQVMLIPYDFIPKGWAACNGALLPIQQNPALYSLIGNHYGGDGRTTFALPKMEDTFGCRYIIALQGIYPQRS